jgi:hypothetical protein
VLAPATIQSIALASPLPVQSGDRVCFRITGQSSAKVHGARACSIRVRSLTTGQVLFAVETGQCGVTIPDDGPFTIEVELQFNVPAGVYAVETSVWDRATHRDVARGPSLTLQVEDGQMFFGTVQMLPRMHLMAADLAAVS